MRLELNLDPALARKHARLARDLEESGEALRAAAMVARREVAAALRRYEKAVKARDRAAQAADDWLYSAAEVGVGNAVSDTIAATWGTQAEIGESAWDDHFEAIYSAGAQALHDELYWSLDDVDRDGGLEEARALLEEIRAWPTSEEPDVPRFAAVPLGCLLELDDE